MTIAENIKNITMKLSPAVRLVAVSKFHPLECILEAYSAGQRVFAESRPQELYAKVQSLGEIARPSEASSGAPSYSDIEWHFIGHLQTNKLKLVLPYVSMVQSVDTAGLLEAIDAWGQKNGKVTNVLLECHIAMEETKQGFSADEIREILLGDREYPNVRFCGLMGMATFTDDEAVIRSDFSRIKALYDEISAAAPGHPSLADFKELSIGMSEDYMIAMEYGATMVRIGTSIFGPRQY